MKREWLRGMRLGSWLSLIFMDVDFFKGFNDLYGHARGDECLIAVAGAIAAAARRPADLAARYGGEEFVVILPDTNAEGAFKVAEQIRKAVFNLGMQHETSDAANVVTLSLGVHTMIPRPGDDLTSFIEKTDFALYKAKKSGRNRVATVSIEADDVFGKKTL